MMAVTAPPPTVALTVSAAKAFWVSSIFCWSSCNCFCIAAGLNPPMPRGIPLFLLISLLFNVHDSRAEIDSGAHEWVFLRLLHCFFLWRNGALDVKWFSKHLAQNRFNLRPCFFVGFNTLFMCSIQK